MTRKTKGRIALLLGVFACVYFIVQLALLKIGEMPL